MLDILVRAGCFVAIIVLGNILRKKEFLPKESFRVLSKIMLNITLPGAVIAGAAGKGISFGMLTITLLGVGCGCVYMLVAWLANRRRSREQQAFEILNLPGYNIGNFSLPFIQSFLGPMGVVAVSLFDVGNAFICLGGASYGVASSVKDGKPLSWKNILIAPFRSVPFLCFVIMAVLNLFKLSPPAPVLTLAQIAGNANPFLAMLVIGVGFQLSGEKSQLGIIVRVLILRYAVAAALAAAFYFLLPFSLEMRQALVLLTFSPIGSAIPPFTAKLGGDVGLSSAINSISVVCSIPLMVALLLIML